MQNNKSRKRLSGTERREQILDHTFKLVAIKGFKSVSVRDIAQSAGVNEALIYKHFPGKEALLKEVINRIIKKTPQYPENIPETLSEFKETVLRFEEFFIDLNMNDPSSLKTILYAALEEYPLPPEFDIKREGTFLHWLNKCILKGQEEWGFQKNIPREVYISLFTGGLIHFILETSVIKAYKINPDEVKGSFTELFIKSLKG